MASGAVRKEHGIAETEKAVLFLNRNFVGVQHMLPSGESGNQHNQGTFRQMEIGDQPVHGLEFVPRIDENIRPFGARSEGTVRLHQRFQGAAGGGAHANNAPALFPGFIQKSGGFLVHHAQL